MASTSLFGMEKHTLTVEGIALFGTKIRTVTVERTALVGYGNTLTVNGKGRIILSSRRRFIRSFNYVWDIRGIHRRIRESNALRNIKRSMR